MNYITRFFSSVLEGPIRRLPSDLLANEILLPLDYDNLVRLCNTNKEMRSICNDRFWSTKIKRDFPNLLRNPYIELDIGMNIRELYLYYSKPYNVNVYIYGPIENIIIGKIKVYPGIKLPQINSQIRYVYENYYNNINKNLVNRGVLTLYLDSNQNTLDAIYLLPAIVEDIGIIDNPNIDDISINTISVMLFPKSYPIFNRMYRLFECIANVQNQRNYFTSYVCQPIENDSETKYYINLRNIDIYKQQLIFIMKLFHTHTINTEIEEDDILTVYNRAISINIQKEAEYIYNLLLDKNNDNVLYPLYKIDIEYLKRTDIMEHWVVED